MKKVGGIKDGGGLLPSFLVGDRAARKNGKHHILPLLFLIYYYNGISMHLTHGIWKGVYLISVTYASRLAHHKNEGIPKV